MTAILIIAGHSARYTPRLGTVMLLCPVRSANRSHPLRRRRRRKCSWLNRPPFALDGFRQPVSRRRLRAETVDDRPLPIAAAQS